MFGCNKWAKSIADQASIDGFVDDVTKDIEFYGKPVMGSVDLPKSALVVSAVVGERPMTAMKRITEQSTNVLDYYSFQKYSGLSLKQVMFLGKFNNDFLLTFIS